VVDHLEEAKLASCTPHFCDDGGPLEGIAAGEVDGGDGVRPGAGGLEGGESLEQVDEEGKEGSEAKIDKTFDAELGFFELLELLGLVEGLLRGVNDAHGCSL